MLEPRGIEAQLHAQGSCLVLEAGLAPAILIAEVQSATAMAMPAFAPHHKESDWGYYPGCLPSVMLLLYWGQPFLILNKLSQCPAAHFQICQQSGAQWQIASGPLKSLFLTGAHSGNFCGVRLQSWVERSGCQRGRKTAVEFVFSERRRRAKSGL